MPAKGIQGLKTREMYTRRALNVLLQAAQPAAKYLKECTEQQHRCDNARIGACKYVLDQVIGQASPRNAMLTGEKPLQITHVVIVKPAAMGGIEITQMDKVESPPIEAVAPVNGIQEGENTQEVTALPAGQEPKPVL